VGRYLAARSDFGPGLNLDECPDFGFIANNAPIQVDEVGMVNLHAAPQSNIFCYCH
jgi:hypothetical protein